MPLRDIRILDLTRGLSGSLATKYLANYGAEVIKIEPPEGDPTRRYAPIRNGESLYFRYLSAGKKSVLLDYAQPEGAALLRPLLRKADVVCADFRPSEAKALGLDYESLKAEKPDLILASVTPYGLTGPLAEAPASSLTVQARSVAMDMTGMPGGYPVQSGPSIPEHYAAGYLATAVTLALIDREKFDAEKRCRDAKIPCCAVLDVREIVDAENTRVCGFLQQQGDFRFPSMPVILAETPPPTANGSPPWGPTTTPSFRKEETTMGMLDGVKVLDFTHAYAGPFCTMTMADFGAQVIKIEKVSGGDQARSWGPFKNGYSGYYASFNRGKKSLPLDLRAPEAKEIIRRLIAESDIICSNFKAGTMEKMGFSYEEVRQIKPDIIFAELSGFGSKGALSAYAAYDNVMQAVSGVMDLNGFPDGVPQKIGPAIGDSYSGLVLLLGITIAYYRKLKTGQGCRVDATMLGSLITALEYPVMEYTDCGKLLHRDGNRSPWYAPGDVYRAKDSYVALSVKTDTMWQTFLERTGFPQKANYQTAALRLENRDALKTDLEAFLKDTTGKELEAKLAGTDIPAAEVMGIAESLQDPQLLARDMVLTVKDPVLGDIQLVGDPMKLSENPVRTDVPSPTLGQDTKAILLGLGYRQEELDDMKHHNIIAWEE